MTLAKTRASRWIWITWERQRRSVEMARALGCKLYVFDYSGSFRYVRCIFSTLFACLRDRPKILFVQNPSMVLAVFAACMRPLGRFALVVDRHSSFRVGKQYVCARDRNRVLRRLVEACNSYSIRRADITIVTNAFLADVVKRYGGVPFILPDKLPDIECANPFQVAVREGARVLLVSSFGRDEPVEEAVEAMRMLLNEDVVMHVSGNCRKLRDSVLRGAPSNVVFTGFMAEDEYLATLCASDAVIALTTSDHTMLCGCYEAVAAGKPLITSDKKVLVDYFSGARFVSNEADSIREAIVDVLFLNREKYLAETRKMQIALAKSWGERFIGLCQVLEGLRRSDEELGDCGN
ncbi:MAG TPA: glycosyltransferase [bacterium]